MRAECKKEAEEMNRIFDPRELAAMAQFYEEVRRARLQETYAGQRSRVSPIMGPEFRPLRGLPDNKRGNSIVLAIGDPFQTVVEARTPEAEVSEMLTLTVGLEQQGSTTAAQDGDLVGRVVWGIAGAHFQSEIDVYRGLTISLPANYLRFDVSYPTPALVPPVPIQYQVSAGVAYGTVFGPQAPPRFTQGPFHLDANGGAAPFVDLLIPKWAVSFTVNGISDAPASQPNLRILVANASTTRSSIFEYVSNRNTSNQFETQFPYFNGRERMRVTNLDAVNGYTVNVIHTLSF